MDILKTALDLVTFKKSTGGGTQKDTEVLRKMPDFINSIEGNYRFKRSTYHSLINIAIFEAGLMLVLVLGCIAVIVTAKPVDRFFVAAVDGRISQILPLDTPMFNDGEMFSRVADGLASAMTFGYLDYEQRRQGISNMFEPGTLDALLSQLTGNATPDTLTREGQVFVSKVPNQGVTIRRKGVNPDSIYEWLITVRLDVTKTRGFGTGAQSTLTPMSVTVLVQRARAVEVQRGFTIARLVEMRPLAEARPVAPEAASTP